MSVESTGKYECDLKLTLAEIAPDPDPDGTAEVIEVEIDAPTELAAADVTALLVRVLDAMLVEAELASGVELMEAEEVTETCAAEELEAGVETVAELEPGVEMGTELGVETAEVEAEPVVEMETETEAEVETPGTADEVVVVESSWIVHVLTSWTAGWPLLPVTGVSTMVHVSVAGPSAL